MSNTTPTAAQIAEKAEDWGMTIEETLETIIQDASDERRRVWIAEFNRLYTFDATDASHFTQNAQGNAADTCNEEGAERDGERYWEVAVATLSCELDTAGISTR